jgi:predicted nucleic acid-binding protein
MAATARSAPVFLDSGILIAFLNSRDRWHEHAVALFALAKPRWCTSFLVVSEAYSWFLHRHGEEAARSLRILLDNLEGLRIFDIDKHHQQQLEKTLDRLRGAKLTYVDASSLCFMERHKIKIAWSTDHHLGLAGAEVLPRV